jgi:SAM-dependent methyltransferase
VTLRPAFDRAALPYWDARAPGWNVAPPLAPGEEDVRFYEECAARLRDPARPLDALLLGVTAPIAAMRWPTPTRLVALDWSEEMLRHVWPRDRVPEGARALRGDWREIPLRGACIDFAIGDGCYSTFADLRGPGEMNREINRVLRPGGIFCLRCFRRPDIALDAEALFDDLLAGRIRNLDLFRWLLAMALQGDDDQGVSLNRVWQAWHARVPDPGVHRARRAWSGAAVANLEAWSRLDSRYFFPNLAELRALAAPLFELEACDIPGYEWGAQFPRLVMRRAR